MSDWKTLSTRIAYKNPFIYVQEDEVINPGGQETVYGVVHSTSHGGVFIVPVDEHGNTYLVRQFRYTKQKMTWECIAGRADEADTVAAAARELREEAAILADAITAIGHVDTAIGATTLTGHVFLAEGLHEKDLELDQIDGILEKKKVPLATVIDMIMNGEIQCTESIAAFFMVREYLKNRVSNVS